MSKKSKVITIVSVFLVLVLLAVAIYFAVPKVLDTTWAEIFNFGTTTETPADDPDDDKPNFVEFHYGGKNANYVGDFSVKYTNTEYSQYENERGLLIPGETVNATFVMFNPSRLISITIKGTSIPFVIQDDNLHVQFTFVVPNEDFGIILTASNQLEEPWN